MGDLLVAIIGTSAIAGIFWLSSRLDFWFARQGQRDAPSRRSSIRDADLLVSRRGPFF